LDRDEYWAVKRDELIVILTDVLSRHSQSVDRRVKFARGVLCYLESDKKVQDEFYEALSNGAKLRIIPLDIGETGRYSLLCCGEVSATGYSYPIADEVELTVFAHQVWTCPRCGKVYALYNEAADGGCDDTT
jgi:uncharacterized protein with PIN domain